MKKQLKDLAVGEMFTLSEDTDTGSKQTVWFKNSGGVFLHDGRILVTEIKAHKDGSRPYEKRRVRSMHWLATVFPVNDDCPLGERPVIRLEDVPVDARFVFAAQSRSSKPPIWKKGATVHAGVHSIFNNRSGRISTARRDAEVVLVSDSDKATEPPEQVDPGNQVADFSGISLSDTEAKAKHHPSHHRVCVVRDLETHSDDRGWLREVIQADCGKLQVNVSLTYPGVIKAFHRHANQADYFTCVSGAVKYVVATETVDSMPGNNDYEFSVYILSEDHPRCIEVPSGVLHGYKVLGSKPAVVMYCATNWYDRDNPDEERVDPSIYSDWETENR